MLGGFVARGRQNRGARRFVGRERLYVQAAYLLASEQAIEREPRAYEGLVDNFPKYVETMDTIEQSRNDVRPINTTDFLLGNADQTPRSGRRGRAVDKKRLFNGQGEPHPAEASKP